jgi:hypothetical protein
VTATASAAATGPEAGPEAGSKSAGTAEAASETAAEAGSERTVTAGVVAADVLAELPTGLPALLVQSATILRREAEARRCSCERSAHVRGPICVKKWVVHVLISFLESSAECATDTTTIYR